uniref:Zyg eleven-related protein 1 n=1 Tax=Rhabditophanes sp. KR3021 TaxID=114890 RepID=A0AC35TYF9_9BILA
MPQITPLCKDLETQVSSLVDIAANAIAQYPDVLDCQHGKQVPGIQEASSESYETSSTIADEDDVFHSCESTSLSSMSSGMDHFLESIKQSTNKEYQISQEDCVIEPSTEPHYCLPIDVTSKLFEAFRAKWRQNTAAQPGLKYFLVNSCLPLSEINLEGTFLNDEIVATLLVTHHQMLQSLNIGNLHKDCNVSVKVNKILEKRNISFPNLKCLKITNMDLLRNPYSNKPIGHRFFLGNMSDPNNTDLPVLGADALDDILTVSNEMTDHWMSKQNEKKVLAFNHFTTRCPNLEVLIINKGNEYTMMEESPDTFLSRVVTPLSNLKVLDISEWLSLTPCTFIDKILNITTLILFDVRDIQENMKSIFQLKQLVYLDISTSNPDNGNYKDPTNTLRSIIVNLPMITHLDISQTNLCRTSPNQKIIPQTEYHVKSDIIGLRRMKKPLEFLGIYNCAGTSQYTDIPAIKIAGDINEEQLLLAMEVYNKRPSLLQAVLNEAYQMYRFSTNLRQHAKALHLVLKALSLHKSNAALQIAGSAAMFYILRHVIMNRGQVMVRNCALSLCQFDIPQEVLFDYHRLSKLLVNVLKAHSSDQLTQRIVIFLLNSLACHVDREQKIQVGEMGAIEAIVEQINRKVVENRSDDVMEVGWSFLWNITDETPMNCERFLKAEGLALFYKCYTSFNAEREVVRNILGLLGNIAEVKLLRSQMMKDEYIKIFCDLLNDNVENGGIEISYNAAGVLSHLVSDGEQAWKGIVTSRDDVMNNINNVISKWNVHTRRFINYRSFKPILALVPLFDSPASQKWALFALANLSTTDLDKYCTFIEEQGGIPLLLQIKESDKSPKYLLDLVDIIFRNINKWKNGITNGDSDDEGEEMDQSP